MLDINNPETFNEQEIFNYVIEKLAQQGKRSRDENGCVYYNENGLKCAVGHLIPNHLYQPSMDKNGGIVVDLLLQSYTDLDYLDTYKNLLVALQKAHDLSNNITDIQSQLQTIAKEHHLNPFKVSAITKWS